MSSGFSCNELIVREGFELQVLIILTSIGGFQDRGSKGGHGYIDNEYESGKGVLMMRRNEVANVVSGGRRQTRPLKRYKRRGRIMGRSIYSTDDL